MNDKEKIIRKLDEEMLRYVDFYLKKVIKNSVKDYYREKCKHKKYGLSFVSLDEFEDPSACS